MAPAATTQFESFSHLADIDVVGQPCQGLACFVARHAIPSAGVRPPLPRTRVCTAWGSATPRRPRAGDEGDPHTSRSTRHRRSFWSASPPAALATLEAYRRHGGLRGPRPGPGPGARRGRRGGRESRAARPRGRRLPDGKRRCAPFWRNAQVPKYVVCNADEGDPGVYIDRFVMEDDPYLRARGDAVAGRTQSGRAGLHLSPAGVPSSASPPCRARSPRCSRGGCARSGRPRSWCLLVRRRRSSSAKGSYVCGEETALLNAIEGRRPEVRGQAAVPRQSGLVRPAHAGEQRGDARNIPWIVRHGGDAYAALGRGESRGTKVLSLNSLFARPGLYEVELGRPRSGASSTTWAAGSGPASSPGSSWGARWPASSRLRSSTSR